MSIDPEGALRFLGVYWEKGAVFLPLCISFADVTWVEWPCSANGWSEIARKPEWNSFEYSSPSAWQSLILSHDISGDESLECSRACLEYLLNRRHPMQYM